MEFDQGYLLGSCGTFVFVFCLFFLSRRSVQVLVWVLDADIKYGLRGCISI